LRHRHRPAQSHKPIGAYELIDRLGEDGKRPAPTTIYRTLEFLIGQGLVHRIESRNAFIACSSAHRDGDVAVFLLCQGCGRAAEADASHLGLEFRRLAEAADFSPRGQVVELAGYCRSCRPEREASAAA
jgi:Fur family zinc uptake transcriptional regulator